MEAIHIYGQKEGFGKHGSTMSSNNSKNMQKHGHLNAMNKNPKNPNMKIKNEFVKMKMKNETLAKLIKTKNSEIADLKNSSKSLHNILNSVPDDGLHYNPSLANHKLVEVNNQNRRLNVELMATKKQLNKKDLQLKEKDFSLRMVENKLKKLRTFDIIKSNKMELKGHMTELDKMISTVHSKNKELVSQLNSAMLCLHRETGHKWDLKEFIYNSTDWEGRAQQIKDLEFQIKHYNDQIDSYKRLLNLDDPYRKVYCEKNDYDTISTEEIIQSAKIRTLEAENSSLRKDLKKLKSQVLNLRVGNEALNEEVLQCRTLICSIEQHTSNSKNSMTTLRDMVVQQQKDNEKSIRQKNDEIAALKKQLTEATKAEQLVKTRLEESERAAKNNAKLLEILHEENKKLEFDLKSFCGGFLFSCRDLRKDEFIEILESFELEKKHFMTKIMDLEERLKTELKAKADLLKRIEDREILIKNLELELDHGKKTDQSTDGYY